MRMKLDSTYGGDYIELQNALYVPRLSYNLLSISRIVKKGCTITFGKDKCQVSNENVRITAAEKAGL